MENPCLIVVHGMGEHTQESVLKEVNAAFKTIFSRYESLKNVDPEERFDLIAVDYNRYFEDYRKALGEQAGSDVAKALAGVQGDFPFAKAAEKILNLGASVTEDKFFNTHWLDVILYRLSLRRELIQLDLAARIAKEVRDRQPGNVHVLGHSLGTSVVHDTLAKLYGPEEFHAEVDPVEQKKLKLHNDDNRVGSIHMVSNVSRLLASSVKVGASEVRPSRCCSAYLEYRHKLDPFAKLAPFDPTITGWVPPTVYQDSYELIEPKNVTDLNVHGLTHYLINPEVHLSLLWRIMSFYPSDVEIAKAWDEYFSTTIEGQVTAVREAFESFNYTIGEELPPTEKVKKLLEAGVTLKDAIESLGGKFS